MNFWKFWNTKYFVLKLISFNIGQLQNNVQLQNNSVNGAMSFTITRVIIQSYCQTTLTSQCSYQTILAVSSLIELLLNNTDVCQTSNIDVFTTKTQSFTIETQIFQSSYHAILTWVKKYTSDAVESPKPLKITYFESN